MHGRIHGITSAVSEPVEHPRYGASLGPIAVRSPEIQPFSHSWVLHWVLTELES